MIKHESTCKICGSTQLINFYKNESVPLAGLLLFDKTEPFENFTTDVYACLKCNHVQLLDSVSDEVYKNYLYTPSNSRGFIEYVELLADSIVKNYGIGKAVEIGSSNGKFLELLKNRGCEVLGYEPSTRLSKMSKDLGINTLESFFTEASVDENTNADFVIIRHVLEHIDDLHDVMKGVNKAINKDGVFIIEVPYLLNIIKEKQFYAFFNEHLSYFSATAINNLLSQYGFKIIDIGTVHLEGGSLIIYASKSEKFKETKNLKFFIHVEADLLSLIKLTKFSFDSKKFIEDIKEMVQFYFDKGYKVAAWGAGQRGVTLLNLCKFNTDKIKYVVDVNPDYQNKTLPGCNIPVVNPSAVYSDPVDVIIILATGYANQIIEDNELFTKNGGTFIKLI
jgi:novobiocin biosynthesis protein NovU/D-mycarose 3-C-methyltransferase